MTCSKCYSSSSTKSYTKTMVREPRNVNPLFRQFPTALVTRVISAVQFWIGNQNSIIERQVLISNTLRRRQTATQRSEESPCISTTTVTYPVTRESSRPPASASTGPRSFLTRSTCSLWAPGPRACSPPRSSPSSRASRPGSWSAAPGRLAIGQADGIQARSVETFQAFGFAERIIAEAYRITEMAFWKPDPADPSRIHPQRPHRGRPGRDQRVPAPDRQPGPRAGLLRRVHGELAHPHVARTTGWSSAASRSPVKASTPSP